MQSGRALSSSDAHSWTGSVRRLLDDRLLHLDHLCRYVAFTQTLHTTLTPTHHTSHVTCHCHVLCLLYSEIFLFIQALDIFCFHSIFFLLGIAFLLFMYQAVKTSCILLKLTSALLILLLDILLIIVS